MELIFWDVRIYLLAKF